jgi:uncharacterized protein (DUF362 family)
MHPEYPFKPEVSREANPAYAAVRGALQLLGADGERFGRPDWDPLGEIIRPGDTVVLKPNFIRDFHDMGMNIESVVTHGSIIRAVLDYVTIALKGRGRVVIADAPQCEARFDKIRAFTGLDEIQAFYSSYASIPVDVIDLRPEYTEKIDGVIIGHKPLPGDPAGYAVINLGDHSAFKPINHMNHRLYGSEYDRSEVTAHHYESVHEYLISKTILDADVFINLPKLKTHKKVGVTLNLKNLVGINGNKNWLPHHREGVPAKGGDQYADSGMSERIEHVLLAMFKNWFPLLGPFRRYLGRTAKSMGTAIFGDTNTTRVRSGNWYGNDTTWRMVLDLNRALRYGDGTGALHETPQRHYFSFVDGIVGGDGNGPLAPNPRPVGLVMAGADALAVDLVCTRLMGLDYRSIPTLHEALQTHPYPLKSVSYEQVACCSNVGAYSRPLEEIEGPCFAFRPHFGWVGHVEWDGVMDGTANVETNQAG